MNFEVLPKGMKIKNGKRVYNRPMYYKEKYGYVCAGAYPSVRIVAESSLYGSVFFGQLENGKFIPFQEYEVSFFANKTVYKVNPDLQITVIPVAKGAGYCMKVSGTCKQVAMVYGGLYSAVNGRFALRVNYDPGRANTKDFVSETEYQDTTFTANEDGITMQSISEGRNIRYFFDKGAKVLVDTIAWSEGLHLPYVTLPVDGAIRYVFADVDTQADEKNPCKQFRLAENRLKEEASHYKIHTPEKRINALTEFARVASDASFVNDIYNHGGCAWSMPYLGWENMVGGVVLGKAENIAKEAKMISEYVVREDEKTTAIAWEEMDLVVQDKQSVFFGLGYIDKYQGNPYNVQS